MTEKLCDKHDFIRLIYIFIATKLYEKSLCLRQIGFFFDRSGCTFTDAFAIMLRHGKNATKIGRKQNKIK